MQLTIKEYFHRGTVFFSFSYHKITLLEKKYDIKLINLIPMYHLTLLRWGGGYGKIAYPLADLIFRIEEKFFTAPFSFTFNIFQLCNFCEKNGQKLLKISVRVRLL